MNNELQELENELKRLIPRAPSELVEARIEAALVGNASGANWNSRMWSGLALAGVAAALALVGGFTWIDPAQMPLRPVAVENEVCNTYVDGVIKLADGTKAWRTRVEYVDTVRWSGEGRTLTMKAPREEQRLVPLEAY